jgi:hypothetical protein
LSRRGYARFGGHTYFGSGKRIVADVLDELGFDGVDAGGLDEFWRQQPGSPVYATDFDVAAGVKRAQSEATKERKPEWRSTANSPENFANLLSRPLGR